MSLPVRMADSVEPANIPAVYEAWPNGVAIYANGRYAWSTAALARFPRFIAISVTGVPATASFARVLDVEKGDATPSDVPHFLDARRKKFGKHSGMIYASRSLLPAIMEALDGRPEPDWWIPTLDNHPWTPAELAADISRHWGVSLTQGKIRAIQWQDAHTFDGSSVWGQMHWTLNPHHGANLPFDIPLPDMPDPAPAAPIGEPDARG